MKIWHTIAILLACGFLLVACQPVPRVHTAESFVFGTRVELLVWGETKQRAQIANSAVLREFERLQLTYHAWKPSQMTTLNKAIAADKSADVSPELGELLRSAKEFAELSDFMFDPGIGMLIKLWGFQSDEVPQRLPETEALQSWQKSSPSIAALQLTNLQVSSNNSELALDFGGYLKGVALDNAAGIFKKHNIKNALINIGGNILALGSKGETPWRVGIQHPRASTPIATLDLHDGEAIGTSGDYQRYFELAGKRYHHILDPRTGMPADATQAVTLLISPRVNAGTWSDWASKPLFIAGDKWHKMAQKLGVTHVLRISHDGRIELTPAMKARLNFKKENTGNN